MLLSHKMFYQTIVCLAIGLTFSEAFLFRDFLFVPFWSSSDANEKSNSEDITVVDVSPSQLVDDKAQERILPTRNYQKNDGSDVLRSKPGERINWINDDRKGNSNDRVVKERVDITNQGEEENLSRN